MEVLFGLLALAAPFLFATLPANLASEKGRRFWVWYAYGFFLFAIATIHALALKPTPEAAARLEAKIRQESERSGARACPSCNEMMRAEIETCGLCGAAMTPA